ncbi:MAG: glycosyltransferase family 39 protein [Candidatus Sumerlaeota bacterium]|nr:glycosyltransferase family 39 protein [Candidatus Sumerlaeota bacterium]
MLCWNDPGALDTPDTAEYLTLAHNLKTHFEYCEGANGISPAIKYPPLFPFFLAAQDFTLGRSLNTLSLMQALLGMVACALIYAAAFALIGSRGAVVAGLMAAFDPVCATGSLLISHEGLYLFFLALAVWALTQAFVHDYPWAWAAGGGAVALAALTWSDALWLWVPVALGFLIQRRVATPAAKAAEQVTRNRRRHFALFMAIFTLFAGSWFARNYWVTGEWGFAAEPAIRWVENRQAALVMKQNGVGRAEAIALLNADFKARPDAKTVAGFERARLRRFEAIKALTRRPTAALEFWGWGIWQTLAEPELDVMKSLIRIVFPQTRISQTLTSIYAFAGRTIQWALLALIIGGALWRRSWRGGFTWWGPVIYLLYFLPFLGDLDAGASLRLALTPALYLLAAREIEQYWPWFERRFSRYGSPGFVRVIHEGPIIQSNGGPRL